MPHDRFYLNGLLERSSDVCVEGAEWHHLANVMRVREGETVELVNGKGALAEAKVVSLEKKRAKLHILTSNTEQRTDRIFLGIPILRLAKLEWILEKGTELGVDTFLLYPAEHGEKRDLSENQLERLRTLTISAMKQSGRLFLPHLEVLANFDDLFFRDLCILYGDLDSTLNPQSLMSIEWPVLFITGPESGFSKEETLRLKNKGTGVRLSEHILRAETAPIAAASILAYVIRSES